MDRTDIEYKYWCMAGFYSFARVMPSKCKLYLQILTLIKVTSAAVLSVGELCCPTSALKHPQHVQITQR